MNVNPNPASFYLTEFEFADVQRLVADYEMTPLYKRRDAARLLTEMVGAIHDHARDRQKHEVGEDVKPKR